MAKLNDVLTGDNVEVMQGMPDNYVDLTVTSPPYDGLRSYNGYSFDFESVAKELYRITKDGGVVVWVVGDATKKGSESGTSFKQALFFKEIGFNLHDTMIYLKNSYIPLTHNRYEQQFEYMFVFSKGKPKTFTPIKIPTTTAGTTRNRKKYKEEGQGMRGREESTKVKDEKIKGNVWVYDVGKNEKTLHPAVFPETLVNDHILSWSNPGDIVLDPFGGSGTTAKMAILNKRNYLHIDVSDEYNGIARQRINEAMKTEVIGGAHVD